MARRKTRSKKRISRFTVAGVIIFCSITCGILVYNGSVFNGPGKRVREADYTA